jgi:cellulose synthase/poly-beta-1,6-N-acetylglucosamine synthase-like glycosyltransferase
MRVLGSAVLVMEFFVMGFAVLLAKDNGEPSSVIAGLILALLFLLTPGILKKKSGWIFGSLLQIPMIAYAVVVPSMALVGPIFAGLWVAAIVIGRKGEAIRAKLLAESDGAQES